MDSYSEVRRVRNEMSEAAEHDVRKLAAMFNARRAQVVERIIDPGTKAEQCGALEAADNAVSNEESSSATR